MLKLFFLIILNASAANENFENVPSGPFKIIQSNGMTIEAGFNDVSFIGVDEGRPTHFGNQSLYSSGQLVLTFSPPVSQVGVSATPYTKGRGYLECWLIDTQTGQQYRYPMTDTTVNEMQYGQFDNLGAAPFRRYKINKCIVKGLNEGIWIDAVVGVD